MRLGEDWKLKDIFMMLEEIRKNGNGPKSVSQSSKLFNLLDNFLHYERLLICGVAVKNECIPEHQMKSEFNISCIDKEFFPPILFRPFLKDHFSERLKVMVDSISEIEDEIREEETKKLSYVDDDDDDLSSDSSINDPNYNWDDFEVDTYGNLDSMCLWKLLWSISPCYVKKIFRYIEVD